MNLNKIRKILFTNIIAEKVFIFFLKRKILTSIINKLIPINTLYSKETRRKVKRNQIIYELDISDYQAWLIYYLSDKDSSLKVIEYLGDSEIIIDIGANIGQTTLEINKNRLQQKKDFKIICFEPFSQTYLKLKRNLQLNNSEYIIPEKLALGNSYKKINMYKDCVSNSGGNRIVYNNLKNNIDVQEVTINSLDNYLDMNKINKIDFIKIDVEGYEYEVLSGATNTLKKYKPKLFIELDDQNLKNQGCSADKLLSFLEDFNYTIKDVEYLYTKDELKKKPVHTDIYCE